MCPIARRREQERERGREREADRMHGGSRIGGSAAVRFASVMSLKMIEKHAL